MFPYWTEKICAHNYSKYGRKEPVNDSGWDGKQPSLLTTDANYGPNYESRE